MASRSGGRGNQGGGRGRGAMASRGSDSGGVGGSGGRRGGGRGRGARASTARGGGDSGGSGDPSSPPPPHSPPPRRSPPYTAAPSPRPPLNFRDLFVSTSSSSSSPAQDLGKEKVAILPQTAALPIPQPSFLNDAAKLPRRPSLGTKGKKCLVKANHFLVSLEGKKLCCYDVRITPPDRSMENRRNIRSGENRRKIISELVKIYKDSYRGMKMLVYDGGSNIYSAGRLPFDSKDFKLVCPTVSPVEYHVEISLVECDVLHRLDRFLQEFSETGYEVPQNLIQVLNTVIREHPSTRYVPISRLFFSPGIGIHNIGEGMECCEGYFQTLHCTQMGLSLNLDISVNAFYKTKSVVDFTKEYLNISTDMPLSDRNHANLERILQGVIVEISHCNQRHKIRSLSTRPLSDETFIDDRKQMKSVKKYFSEKHNLNLELLMWPCLVTGSEKRPTYLPMEVCNIVGHQRVMQNLSGRQLSKILKEMNMNPSSRESKISKMVCHNNHVDKHAREFGIGISSDLVLVEARVLPPPKLKFRDFGNPNIEMSFTPEAGSWNMIDKKLFNGGKIDNWTCINFSRIQKSQLDTFCTRLFKKCSNIGMTINTDPVIEFLFYPSTDVKSAFRNLSVRLGKRSLQLLLIVLPEGNEIYGTVKKICETELGIVSQCCKSQHIEHFWGQYLGNLALKINAKVGGRNTVLEDAINWQPLVEDKQTIVFGADVTHPSPGDDSSPSIAAVVASMDWPEVSKYRCLLSEQPARVETIKELSSMVKELLLGFRQSSGKRPERIIFYRDGVGEGQFKEVLDKEVLAIRQACNSLGVSYSPPITFVVVIKRHHTRLFPNDSKSADSSGNILAGTIVDTKICHYREFDFYLCSHAGIKGTSRPTRYHVLYDENKFDADGLQKFTYNLCYTYSRCTRSVSIVPPVFYAHHAAFRGRYYVQGESGSLPKMNEKLKDFMFFC